MHDSGKVAVVCALAQDHHLGQHVYGHIKPAYPAAARPNRHTGKVGLAESQIDWAAFAN